MRGGFKLFFAIAVFLSFRLGNTIFLGVLANLNRVFVLKGSPVVELCC